MGCVYYVWILVSLYVKVLTARTTRRFPTLPP
uniref:Uncharacterized protein n=1 Tax=Siphoviridae sp. ctXZx16 TaxID=2826371 RepID=A0A8S5MKV4_9CAUD|nr:MAG TPA: hypothetical protein [Siphoviridae sp. ctXZx16]